MEKPRTVKLATDSRGQWPDEPTRAASNPLLARWALNASIVATGDSIRNSVALLDDQTLVDWEIDDNPLVLRTEQATLVLEKRQLVVDALWDKLAAHNPPPRTVKLSVHLLSHDLIISLDDGVCAALCKHCTTRRNAFWRPGKRRAVRRKI